MLFIGISIVLLVVGVYIMLMMQDREWSLLMSFFILGICHLFCWVSVLGFFGIEVIAIDSTNTFQVYTYADTWGLNILPFGLLLINSVMMFFGWIKHTKKIIDDATQERGGTVRPVLRGSDYWK